MMCVFIERRQRLKAARDSDEILDHSPSKETLMVPSLDMFRCILLT